MKKIIPIIILIGLVMAGCSQKETQKEAFKVSPPDEIETPSLRKVEVTLPVKGSIQVTIARLRKTLNEEALVSTGVPFGVGQLKSDKDIAFFDGENTIPIATKVLAKWPYDGSIRSVLVQFKTKIGEQYKVMTMKWGEPRTTEDITLSEIAWDIPEAYIVLPTRWLCESEIIGEQVSVNNNTFTEYDKKLLEVYPSRRDEPYTRDVRKDFYYDTVHTFYQIYVRTGDPGYFVSARKEAVKYRDDIIIKEGPERGSTVHKDSRYIFVQAMADDYLLTGDTRSLEVAGYMAEHLKNNCDPKGAFFPKNARHFWTERKYAFPFLGIITYYELTGEKEYLDIASRYMNNLYKTQKQWPERGGFIHNLYSHDPEEGARQDEYGGSPFMTGLLLEPIVEYHRLTGSEIAKESIFMALDWLIREGITPDGDSFYYTTADSQKANGGHPDLNLLIVHAFGYAYKISGYKRADFIGVGRKVFQCGVNRAYLGDRKHFNQSFRSSAHFLAYAKSGKKQAEINEDVFYSEDFEGFIGRWRSPFKDVNFESDFSTSFSGSFSMKIESIFEGSNLSLGIDLDLWNIERFPKFSFAYKISQGVGVGFGFKTYYDDWVFLGGTSSYRSGDYLAKNMYQLIDDGAWHELKIDIKEAVQEVLPRVKELKEFQFYTYKNARKADRFWVDKFMIRRN